MSSSTTRYRMEEFQDDQGNVIYPHTDAGVVWMDEGSLKEFLNTRATDAEITEALID